MKIDGMHSMDERVLRDYIEQQGALQNPFKAAIFRRDEMYHNTVAKVTTDTRVAEFRYYDSGCRSFSVIEQISDGYFSGKPERMLEFASGAGRLTRWLHSWLPNGALDCTDIYEDAVEFQSDYFGVRAFLSALDPRDFDAGDKYDMLYAGSFFTHMPDHLFNSWMQVFGDLVADDGLICFTVRLDYSNVGKGYRGEMPPSGILFNPQSESDVLASEVYGATVVTESYVEDAIRRNIGEDVDIVCFKKAMYENQDLYIVSRKPRMDLRDLKLKIAPICSFSSFQESEDGIDVWGWAVDVDPSGGIQNVVCGLVDGNVVDAKMFPANEQILKYFPATPLSSASRWRSSLSASGDSYAYADVTTKGGATNRCYLFK